MNKLYGESDRQHERLKTVSDNNAYAKRAMREHIKTRNELMNSFWSHIFVTMAKSFCCCFQKCCMRLRCYNARYQHYQKFLIALERLTSEKDIQHVIEMNRVNKLLHKVNFLPRQVRAINYGHKFVISNRDIVKAERADFDKKQKLSSLMTEHELLDGFDPLSCETDRRILHEVTGMRLFNDEFRN